MTKETPNEIFKNRHSSSIRRASLTRQRKDELQHVPAYCLQTGNLYLNQQSLLYLAVMYCSKVNAGYWRRLLNR